MGSLYFFLKHAAAAVAALVAAYSLLWSLGLAFVTNNQAERMIQAGVDDFRKNIFEQYRKTHGDFHRKRGEDIDHRIDKISDDFNSIKTTVGILDERTKQILDSVRRR